MKVNIVGFGSTPTGPVRSNIAVGIDTYPLVQVNRGSVGTSATTHTNGSIAQVYRGSFNIVDSKVYFLEAPKGNNRSSRDISNLPYTNANFSGRTFLRSDYTTNTLFDDISDKFTGIGKTYSLTVQGANTTGMTIGNGILFINGVFQTPTTVNNSTNNYTFIQNAGISSVVFSGISSANGSPVESVFDINQNQLPRGGIIVSLGSTPGLGYAPLVGAYVTAVVSGGSIISVGLGATDITGSGYRGVVSVGVTQYSGHTGTGASITATVGAGGTLSFNVISGGSGYTNPVVLVSEPIYENLPVIGVSRRGIGATTDTGRNMLMNISVGPNLTPITSGRNADAARLIDSNKLLIAQVAVGRMLSAFPAFTIPGGNQNCIDDIVDVLESISYNLRYGGNEKVYDAANLYITGAYVSGEETQSIYAFQQARDMAIQVMRNQSITIGGYSTLTQYFDTTIEGDISGIPGSYTIGDCSDVASAIGSFVGIVTYAIGTLTIPASRTISPGSLFQVRSFQVSRAGYAFNVGDVFRPVGLVTAKGLTQPLQNFELTVEQVFNDYFSAWQFGELDYIDSVKNLQNGSRVRFPLYYNGQLLSFQTDPLDPISSEIDLSAVLVIFINGVLQSPGISYEFRGGTSLVFTQAPQSYDKVDIFFYIGNRNVDVNIVDINETIKIGDEVFVSNNQNLPSTVSQENYRTILDIPGSDFVETDIYVGFGVDEINRKPIEWQKQKKDLVIKGDYIYKSRESIEPQIFPTSKIIKNVSSLDTQIFVDNADFFNYEENYYGSNINSFDASIIPGDECVGAAFTATVGTGGTISQITIVNPGFGYSTPSLNLSISNPINVSSGIGSTAIATASITNGSVSSITIVNPGFGYTVPPFVILETPKFNYETVKTISNIQGFSGIITGITTSPGTGGHPLALKFFYRASAATADDLIVGYPVCVFDTKIGSGVTSVDTSNSSVVGIGTTFLDNIYYVHAESNLGPDGYIICNVRSNSNIIGISTQSYSAGIGTIPVGRISWGRLYNLSRSSNPISIGVTSLVIDNELSRFPTIQRRTFGLRNSGAIRIISSLD
jgi:hypothetical protein